MSSDSDDEALVSHRTEFEDVQVDNHTDTSHGEPPSGMTDQGRPDGEQHLESYLHGRFVDRLYALYSHPDLFFYLHPIFSAAAR